MSVHFLFCLVTQQRSHRGLLLKFSSAPLSHHVNVEFILPQSVVDKEGNDTCLVLYPRMKLLAVKIQEV